MAIVAEHLAFAEAGVLASHGPDLPDLLRRVADYGSRIRKLRDLIQLGTLRLDHSVGGTASCRRKRTVIGALPSQDTKSTSPQ
jgi:hypothetical protein